MAFDSILGKLKNILFEQDGSTPASTTSSATNTQKAQSSPSASANADIVQKVHLLLDKINQPGIDFMELWDATNAMGAVNEQNVANAFLALKVASGNSLTKEAIISSGKNYSNQLQTALQQDVQQKQQMKQEHLQSKQSNINSLQSDISQLKQQIAALQVQLSDKETQLNQISGVNDTTIADIDRKIAEGQAAVAAVVQEIDTMLAIVEKAVK